jgi:hypothetical protein
MTTPRTHKFLYLLHEKLSRNEVDDNYLAFEEWNFTRAYFPAAEIQEILVYLKRAGVVVDYNRYRIRKDAEFLPITKEDKARRMKWSWQELFAGDKAKRRYIIEVTSRDAFYGLYSDHSIQATSPIKASAVSSIPHPIFNEAKGKIEMGTKECKIPMNSNQYILCQKLFAVPFGTQVPSLDISEDTGWSSESGSGVYDTLRGVNKKVKDALGIEPFILWDKEYLSINEKLFKQ